MLSGLLSAELSATCNALGYSSGSTYYTDPYVKETITDLIRYLRRDDEDHTIRRHLGSAKILQTDLLPILIHHSEKEDLFDVLLRNKSITVCKHVLLSVKCCTGQDYKYRSANYRAFLRYAQVKGRPDGGQKVLDLEVKKKGF
ncbi:hypothetical protein J6590_017239 [Homalodisca vitripennis]|nr:hypothetical protein J6590_017239 [Homalodisca vitripennis]